MVFLFLSSSENVWDGKSVHKNLNVQNFQMANFQEAIHLFKDSSSYIKPFCVDCPLEDKKLVSK